MLTASHMPYQNNGMKFFTAEGGLAKPDITHILTAAAEKAAAAGVELGDEMQVGGTASRSPGLPVVFPTGCLRAVAAAMVQHGAAGACICNVTPV